MKKLTAAACTTLFITLAAANDDNARSQPFFLAQKGVPAGFEDLLAPQQSVVDIYYGGRFITTMPVVYTLDTIEFSNPDLLIRQLPTVLDSAAVSKALSGELDTHSEAICLNTADIGCGVIRPKVAGVIFDDSRFRADLFIHPDYLAVRPVDISRYLPDSTAGPAIMQNLTGNISGSIKGGDGKENYTVFGGTFVSFEENNLQANWDFSRDQDLSANQLLLERNYQGHEYQAGLIFSSGFGLNFSSSRRLWGLRVASSFDTRTDRAFTQGTPLDIFMPTQGRYEIIYEDRLISSGFIEAGNQSLDTSRFPGGAYDLTIRLLDEAGNLLSEEPRFFAKQSRLAPVGEPEYFVEAGKIAEPNAEKVLPELINEPVLRTGVNIRLDDTWSGTFAAAGTPGQTLGEASFFNIGRGYELSAGTMVASDKDYGLRGNATYRLQALSLNADYLQLWRDNYNPDDEEFDLLGNAFRQARFSANYPVYGGNASYTYSDSQNVDSSNNKTHQIRQSLAYSRPLYRDNLYSASMRFDTSWTDDDAVTGLFTIELRRSQDYWTFRGSPLFRYNKDTNGNSDTDHSVQVGATYEDRDTFAGRLRSSLQAEKYSDRTTASLSTRYASTWGDGNLDLNYSDSDNSSSTSTYSASLSTSLIANQDVIAFGGETQTSTAVVVNVEGADMDERFDVYVDNQRRGYALGGKPSVIHLSAFDTYKVTIRPEGSGLYSFDEKSYEVTLYPGNVAALDFSVQSVQIVYGRVRLPNGDWLSNASVRGGEGLAVSDGYGLFQAEVSSDTEQLVFNRRGKQCVVDLSPGENNSDVVNLGVVECEIIQ